MKRILVNAIIVLSSAASHNTTAAKAQWLDDYVTTAQVEHVDWDATRGAFKKVMPRDYKRVLDAIARAERDGTDPDEAVMAAAHN